MSYEQRPNSATLFRNRDKKNDNQPDLKGDGAIEIDGQLYQIELAAWTKQSDRAGKFLSLSIKLKGERQSTQPRSNGGRQQFNNHVNQHGTAFDDEGAPPDDKDIPFIVNGDVSPERRLPRA